MMRVLIFLVLVAACDSRPSHDAEEPATTTGPEEHRRGADPERENPQAQAESAYRRALDAFASGDSTQYDAAFADNLRCFFDRADVPRQEIREARRELLANNANEEARTTVHPLIIRFESADENEVVLHDFGWTGRGYAPGTTFHQKRVVLRRSSEGWRIISEAALGSSCGEGPSNITPPPMWTSFRDHYVSQVRECEGEGQEYPGLEGSIGCACSGSIVLTSYCRATSGCGADSECPAASECERNPPAAMETAANAFGCPL